MFKRRLGPTGEKSGASCLGLKSCPGILELESGDYAVIGADITAEAAAKLPADSGCGPGERVVRVPRATLVLARVDIPATL